MTPVRFHFITADGEPFANQTVTIHLPKAGFGPNDSSVVLPQKIRVDTDAQGQVTVDLYPVTQHPYTVQAVDWKTGIKIREIFYVPESQAVVELRDVLLLPAPNNHPFDEVAIQSITQDKIDAQQAREGSEVAQGLSEDAQAASELARDASQTAQGLSEDARDASQLAQAGSEAARDLSLQYRNTSQSHRDAAAASETAAALSETAADLDAQATAADRTYIDGQVAYVDGEVTHVDSQVAHVDTQTAHVDSQTAATDQRASDALASEQKAALWADELEDVAVEPGRFSARHGAAKAAQSEANALTSEQMADQHRQAAAVSEQSAEDDALLAKAWATSVTEVEPGLKSAKEYAKEAKETMSSALEYKGSWDASTGAYPVDPVLGDFWKVNVAGNVGAQAYKVGDSIIYNGSAWDHIDNTESVTSVGGNVGEVTDAHLLAAIKRVHGTGSGLDADTLDGKQLATLEGEYRAYADQAEADAKSYADIGLATKLDASTYTAADVLTKAKSVDGTGSGLDADLLDGKQLSTLETEQQTYADNAAATAEENAKRYAEDQAFIYALIFG